MELIIKLILLITFFFLVGPTTSCIPEIPAPVVEVVNECTLKKPYILADLPIVAYVQEGEAGCIYYRCIIKEEADNESKRETLLFEYSRNMTDLYNDARQRCNK